MAIAYEVKKGNMFSTTIVGHYKHKKDAHAAFKRLVRKWRVSHPPYLMGSTQPYWIDKVDTKNKFRGFFKL